MRTRWHILALAAAFSLAAPAAALAARGYATTTVNMRAGPGTQYPVVDRIPGGARVTIHGCLSDHDWCDVTWRGDRGWVSANYLNYFHRNQYVYLPDYADTIDVPIVSFNLGPYWNRYYAGRPWYQRRAHWNRVWRSHGRYGFRQQAPRARIEERGRFRGPRFGERPGARERFQLRQQQRALGANPPRAFRDENRGPGRRFDNRGPGQRFGRGPATRPEMTGRPRRDGSASPRFGENRRGLQQRPGPQIGNRAGQPRFGGPGPRVGVPQAPRAGGAPQHRFGGARVGGPGPRPGPSPRVGAPGGGPRFGGPGAGAPRMGGAPQGGGPRAGAMPGGGRGGPGRP